MNLSFEDMLIEVWRQTIVENAKILTLGEQHFPVRRTAKRGLRQVDFTFDGEDIRGLEQNPNTKSRWTQMARSGKKVLQFLSNVRYIANVEEGKVPFTAAPPNLAAIAPTVGFAQTATRDRSTARRSRIPSFPPMVQFRRGSIYANSPSRSFRLHRG